MKVKASLWSMKTDHEGEVTIAFKIPQMEAPNIMKLPLLTEQLLDLTIEPALTTMELIERFSDEIAEEEGNIPGI